MYPKPPKQEEQRPLYETSQVRSLIKAHATSSVLALAVNTKQ